jgi:hypothetical protein
MVAVALALGGCTGGPGGPPATPSPTAERTSPSSPSPRPTTSEEELFEKDGFAIWPEDTLDGARAVTSRVEAGDDQWRSDPRETAIRFAREVLRWSGATAAPFQEAPCAACFAVTREAGGPQIYVRLEQRVPPMWWVTYAAGIEKQVIESYSLFFDRTGPHLQGGVAAGEHSGVRLQVGFDGRNEERDLTTDPDGIAHFSFDLAFVPRTTGHLIVLFLEDDGKVEALQAVTLGSRRQVAS